MRLVKVKERQDMRVIEFGDSLCLAQEEPHYILRSFVGIGTKLVTNDFDGHLPVDARILSEVDFAHGSTADEAEHAIASIL